MTARVQFAVQAAFVAALYFSAGCGAAQTQFDFESETALSHPLVSGDISRFALSTEQAHGGTKALKFADSTLEPYESWTYDLPFELTSGTVTVWFYDARGAAAYVSHANVAAGRWGGAIILEDRGNPEDFGAVEINELPYGPKYHASEGAVDRGVQGDRFDADSFPLRSVGHHRVDFHITPTHTTIYVDGLLADEAQAPGSTGNNLRLRFMTDSPSNGGRGDSNWYTSPESSSRGKLADWIYYDDITIAAQLPSALTHKLDFEVTNDVPDYDTTGQFMGPGNYVPPNNNSQMAGFVNQWEAVTSATAAHSGLAAARFTNPPAPLKSLVFDLTGAAAETTATLWYYDALGQNGDRDKAGGSIIIEEGANPGNFHALEITNLPYPAAGPYHYFLTHGKSTDGGYADFYSKGFAARSIGWHKVEIGLHATHSEIWLDGEPARYTATSSSSPGAIAQAPGLDKAPRLRLMADSASVGGFSNWTTIDPLNASYNATREPHVYYDDISIPVTTSNVNDWMNY